MDSPIWLEKVLCSSQARRHELIRNMCPGWFIIPKYSTSVSKWLPQWSPAILLCDSRRMWPGAVTPWGLQDLPTGGRFGLQCCCAVPLLGPTYIYIYIFVYWNGLLLHGGLFVNLWSLSEARWANEKNKTSFFSHCLHLAWFKPASPGSCTRIYPVCGRDDR